MQLSRQPHAAMILRQLIRSCSEGGASNAAPAPATSVKRYHWLRTNAVAASSLLMVLEATWRCMPPIATPSADGHATPARNVAMNPVTILSEPGVRA